MTLNEKIDKLTPNDSKYVEGFVDHVISANAAKHHSGYLWVELRSAKKMAKTNKLMRKICANKRLVHIQWRNAQLKGAVIGSLATLAVSGGLYLYKKYEDRKSKIES